MIKLFEIISEIFIQTNCFVQICNNIFMTLNAIICEQETLINSVKNNSIHRQVSDLSDKQLLMISKKLSLALMKLLNCSSQDQQLKRKFEGLINIIHTLVLEFSDINNYSYLKKILNTYQKQTKKDPKIINLKYKRDVNITWDKRREYQHRKQINDQITNIIQAEENLPDPYNLCCSQLFYKGWHLSHQNSNRKIMIVDYQSLYQYGELEKIICAGLNEGGAYIFVGIKDQTQIVGNSISEEEKETIKGKFINCLNFIYPKVQFPEITLDFVPVFEYSKQHQEGLYIIRIKVNPNHVRTTYYIKNERQGAHNVFSVFIWSKKSYCEVEGRKLYDYMQKKWKKKLKVNFHSFHKCKVPKKSNFLFKQQQSAKISKSNYTASFPYRNQSILLIGSEKKMSYIQELKTEINAYKYKVHIEQPYPQYRNNSSRKIFLISHDPPFKQIDELRSRVDKGNLISFFSLNANLKVVEQKNNTDQKIQQLQVKYEENFDDLFDIQHRDTTKILQFPSIEEALFSFIYLDNLGVRTAFVKGQ